MANDQVPETNQPQTVFTGISAEPQTATPVSGQGAGTGGTNVTAPPATPSSTDFSDVTSWGSPTAPNNPTPDNFKDVTSWGEPVKPKSPLAQAADEAEKQHEAGVPWAGWKEFGLGAAEIPEGIGEGLYGTASGLADLSYNMTEKLADAANIKDPAMREILHHAMAPLMPEFARQFLHKIAGSDEDQNPAENAGKGLENIGEFILGDAALKSLPYVKRLEIAAKAMKTVQGSPKLANALRVGAKILSLAGIQGGEAGTVQGVQSLAHNPNDPEEALREARNMAVTGGSLSAPFEAAGALAEKGAAGANTVEDLLGKAAQGPTANQVNDAAAQKVRAAFQPHVQAANDAIAGSQNIQDQAAQIGQNLAQGAPEASDIAASAQNAAKAAHDQLGTNFENAGNAIKQAATGTTVSFPGSPLNLAAQEIKRGGVESGTPLDQAFSINRPGSAKANAMVDALADEEGTIGLDDAGEPAQLTADHLLGYEKKLNELIRNTGWATDESRADRDIYFTLKDGVHDTLEQLAQRSGNPALVDQVNEMNSAYKKGIRKFNNTDVKALMKGDSNNVAKRLMSGGTSVADIKAVRSAIGEEAFGKLADNSLQRMVADSVDGKTGELSFDKLFKTWNGINLAVRDEMFGKSIRAGMLQDAVSAVQKENALGTVKNSQQLLKDVDKAINSIMGNGDVGTLMKKPERVANLSRVVGPDGMAELGRMIVMNKLRESATTATGEVGNRINIDQFVNFVKSLKDSPEVVDAFFRPTPKAVADYTGIINQMKQVEHVKNAIKYGALAPTVAIGGGMAGHLVGSFWVGHTLATTMLGVLATIAGETKPVVRNVLEDIANNPKVWHTLRALNNPALKRTLPTVITGVTGKGVNAATKPNIYSDAANSLGGTQ